MKLTRSLVMVTLFVMSASVTLADEYVVKLLTTGSNGETMVFEPGFLKVNSGDTIIFEPADPSHNAESFLSPSLDISFATELGKRVSVNMTDEGVYLYKCTPHFMLGMVGVIQVGDAINKAEALSAWESIKSSLVMNQGRMDQYLNQIE